MRNLVTVWIITNLFLVAEVAGAATYIELGLNLVDLDYEEVDSDGDFLDSDTGSLLGYNVAFQWSGSNLYTELRASRNSAVLEYQSVLGDSKVDEEMLVAEVELGLNYVVLDQFLVRPHLFLGSRDWQRDIRSNDLFFGLDEDYSWRYFGIGSEFLWRLNERSGVSVSTRFANTFDADMSVSFLSGDFDPVNLELPRGEYMAGELMYGIDFREGLTWLIAVQAERWNFDRSDSFPLTADGQETNSTVAEPENTTSALTVETGIRFSF